MPPNDPNQRTSTGTTTGSTTTKSNAPSTSNNNRGANNGSSPRGTTQTGPGKTNSQVTTANKTSTTSPRTGARGPTGPNGERKQGPGLAGSAAGNARVASGMPRTTNVTKTPATPAAPSAKVQRPGVGRIAGDPRVSYTPIGSLAPQAPRTPGKTRGVPAPAAPKDIFAGANSPFADPAHNPRVPGWEGPTPGKPGVGQIATDPRVSKTPPGSLSRQPTAYEKFRTALEQDMQRLQKMQNQPPAPGRLTRAARTPPDGQIPYAQEPNLTSYVNVPRAPKIAEQWPGLPADPVRPTGQGFVRRAAAVGDPPNIFRGANSVFADPSYDPEIPNAPKTTAATYMNLRTPTAPGQELQRQVAAALGRPQPPTVTPTGGPATTRGLPPSPPPGAAMGTTFFNTARPPAQPPATIAADPGVGRPMGGIPPASDPGNTVADPGNTVAANDPYNPMQEGEYTPGVSPSQLDGQPQSLSELMNRIGYERDQVKQGWNDLPGKLWDAITNGEFSGDMNLVGNPFGHRTGGGPNNPPVEQPQGLSPALIQQLIAMLQQQTGAATSQSQLQQILSTFV